MNTFNYKDLAFTEHGGRDEGNYHILTFTFLDYHQNIVEVVITREALGSRRIWISRCSGVTTEYSGSLAEVLEKVYEYYKSNLYKLEDKS
jgi:hypothetical protein